MATKLQEDLDKLLECPVCLEQFKQPKVLKCQHSFCLDPCLKKMAKPRQGSSRYKYWVECAICRQKCTVADLNNLSDNLSLKNLIEIRKNGPNPAKNVEEAGKCQQAFYSKKYLVLIIFLQTFTVGPRIVRIRIHIVRLYF